MSGRSEPGGARLLLCLVALGGSLACASAGRKAAPPELSGAQGTSRAAALLAENCGGCHVVETLKRFRKTPEQWERTIKRMGNMGVEVSDEERALLREHLSAPRPSGGL